MFGLIPTPTEFTPWGTFCAVSDDEPEECLELSQYALRGGNQGGTNSCVWWAISNAVWATLGLHGIRQVWPSVLAGYWMTRRNTARGGEIYDLGCMPTDAAEVVRAVGLVPDWSWPFVWQNVDKEPDFRSVISAPDMNWFWLKRVVSYGEYRSSDVRKALAAPNMAARFIIRGQALDMQATEWTTDRGPYFRDGRTVAGRHMELLAGYTRDGVLSVSSWGREDRVDSWEQLESDDTSDLWTVEIDSTRLRRLLASTNG